MDGFTTCISNKSRKTQQHSSSSDSVFRSVASAREEKHLRVQSFLCWMRGEMWPTCTHLQRLLQRFVCAENISVSTVRQNGMVYSFLMMFSHQRKKVCVCCCVLCACFNKDCICDCASLCTHFLTRLHFHLITNSISID